MGNGNPSRRRTVLVVIFWALFGAGILVQVFAPRLKIERNAFVIPPSMVAGSKELHPSELVGRERRMQVVSAVLTFSGALGLAVLYRRTLARRTTPD